MRKLVANVLNLVVAMKEAAEVIGRSLRLEAEICSVSTELGVWGCMCFMFEYACGVSSFNKILFSFQIYATYFREFSTQIEI
jgi:hypothetical protein